MSAQVMTPQPTAPTFLFTPQSHAHGTLLYIHVEMYTYMSWNVRQTGSQGEARLTDTVLDGAETNLVLPLSPAGQEAPPPPPCAAIL